VIPVCWHGCAVFKVREKARPGLGPGLSKLNSMGRTRQARAPPGPADISVVTGWLSRHGMCPPLPRPLQSWSFPRKEVIQPHLPVRLPCYDFTPVTGPTFDGSLPKGLGHRLRVLLASVV
jgi:hypothetical protein